MAIAKTMLDYIDEQPAVLRDMLYNKVEYTRTFWEQYKTLQPDRIYLVASGSSLNAALAARGYMEGLLGIEVQTVAASQLSTVFGQNPYMLYISQGGNSTNTIAAIQLHSELPGIALTGAQNCRINEMTANMRIPCGEELAGPKTKGYTATVLLLYLMALEAAQAVGKLSSEDYREAVEQLEGGAQAFEKNIAGTRNWYESNRSALSQITKCVFVGKHTGAEVAKEAALKVQETLLVPAAGYEFEEYLHGPSMAIDKDQAGFYLMPPESDPDYQRMEALAKFHRTVCPQVYTVGGGANLGDVQDCPLEAGREETRVFPWILPAQLAGALVPEALGLGDRGLDRFKQLDAALGIKYQGRL